MEVVEEDTGTGSANNDSANNDAYSDVSLNISSIEQVVLVHTLRRMWLLIDSCSTTDIFSNASLLTNIHEASSPIWVRCNAGHIQLTQQGYFGNYPHPVWYNPKGVANILSLANAPTNGLLRLAVYKILGCNQHLKSITSLSWTIYTMQR